MAPQSPMHSYLASAVFRATPVVHAQEETSGPVDLRDGEPTTCECTTDVDCACGFIGPRELQDFSDYSELSAPVAPPP